MLNAHALLANGWEHGSTPYEALIKGLASEDTELRGRAAESLGYRGQTEAVGPLLAVLTGPEPEAFVRGAIYAALGRLGSGESFDALRSCLRGETVDTVRAECALSLGMLGQERAVPTLLGLLDGDEVTIVKSRAVHALGYFSGRTVVDRLSMAASSGNGSLASHAVSALGHTGDPRAALALVALLSRARTDEARIALVDALAHTGSEDAAPALQSLLGESENPTLRARAIVALASVGDGGSVPTLIGLLEDPVPGIRLYAVEALRQLASSKAAVFIAQLAQRLLPYMDEEREDDGVIAAAELSVLDLALRAIAELDPASGYDLFSSAAIRRVVRTDSSTTMARAQGVYEVRRRALYGLGYTNRCEAIDLLLGENGIGDPDARLRAVAVRSIGVLGAGHASAAVAELLHDPDPYVRWTAAMVLGRLRGVGAAPELIGGLDDPHREVRRQAILALGYLGIDRARPELEAMSAYDPAEEVRAAAIYSLELIGERDKASEQVDGPCPPSSG